MTFERRGSIQETDRSWTLGVRLCARWSFRAFRAFTAPRWLLCGGTYACSFGHRGMRLLRGERGSPAFMFVEHEKSTFFSLLENTRSGGASQGRASFARRIAGGAKRRAFTEAGAEGYGHLSGPY